MNESIDHWAAIDDFFWLGRELGYISIKEFSLLNVTDDDRRRVDLVWMNGKGEVKYLFEFESAESHRHNFTKIMRYVDAISEIRGAFVFQFRVYESLRGTKLKLINTNIINPSGFLKMITTKADVEMFKCRGKLVAEKLFDKKKKVKKTPIDKRWIELRDIIERPITGEEMEAHYK